DVTAEQEAELARRELEALLKAVVDNIPATITVQDVETERYVLANARIQETMALGADEIIGRRLTDLFPEQSFITVAQQAQTVHDNGGLAITERTVLKGVETR